MNISQPYRNTQVHWGKSQADICRLLIKYGVRDTRFTMAESLGQLICEFNYPTTIEKKDVVVGVRIVVKLTPVGRSGDLERSKNQVHRALFYYLKTKFEALSFGLVEFVQEFLPHLTIFDKSGQSATVYQCIGQQLRHGYMSGEQREIRLLEGPLEDRSPRRT